MVQALDPGLWAVLYERYDRDVGQGPDTLQGLPAIDVEHNQVWLAEAKLKEPANSIWRRNHTESSPTEGMGEMLSHGSIAYDKKNSFLHSASLRYAPL